MTINESQMKEIIRQTVQETLLGLGINSATPQEMQADFVYIRKIRKGAEMTSQKIRASIITITIPTTLYLLWEAIKHAIVR